MDNKGEITIGLLSVLVLAFCLNWVEHKRVDQDEVIQELKEKCAIVETISSSD